MRLLPHRSFLLSQALLWLLLIPAANTRELSFNGLQDGVPLSVKLGGGIQRGIYTVPLRVGTPWQSLVVVVDTTSSDLMVVQSGCTNNAGQPCGSTDGGFSPTASKTFAPANCTLIPTCTCSNSTNQTQPCKLSITSLQLSGQYGVDMVNVGNFSANSPLGLVTYAPSQWSSSTQDGVIGLAYAATSQSGARSVFHFLDTTLFALCFGQTGGTLSLGTTDSTWYSGTPQVVPILQKDIMNTYTRYIVPLVSIGLAGTTVKNTSLPIDTSGLTAVIDSTSPAIQLPSTFYAALRAQLNATCYSSSPSFLLCSSRGLLVNDLTLVYDKQMDLEHLPNIVLGFTDINGLPFTLTLPSTHWVRYWPARSAGYDWEVALAIAASFDENTLILGQTFLSTYYTVFDKSNNITSFAPATDACYYGYSQQPGKVLRVPALLILLGSLGVAALVFGAAVYIILRTRRGNYTVIYG